MRDAKRPKMFNSRMYRHSMDASKFEAPADDPARARQLLLRERERVASLEKALLILESSTAADRVESLEGRVMALRNQIERLTAQFADAEAVVETVRQIDASTKAVAHELLTEQFATVMPLLKELYRTCGGPIRNGLKSSLTLAEELEVL